MKWGQELGPTERRPHTCREGVCAIDSMLVIPIITENILSML